MVILPKGMTWLDYAAIQVAAGLTETWIVIAGEENKDEAMRAMAKLGYAAAQALVAEKRRLEDE
jgi:hypothetical protein